jgi:hypothetical protein
MVLLPHNQREQPMRIPAFIVLATVTCVTASADEIRKRDHRHDIASCQAWNNRLTKQTEIMQYTRTLDENGVRRFNAVIELLGQHCTRADAKNAASLFVVVLDLLTDPVNQP